MSFRRTAVATVTLVLWMSGCAGSDTIESLVATTTTGNPTTTEPPGSLLAPGIIAVAGDPVRLVDSTGAVAADDSPAFGLQPTWARDGSALMVATLEPSGNAGVEVWRPAPEGPSPVVTATRTYFFFSWSDDASRVAALGNGPGGTTLDILDAHGLVVQRSVVEAGSVFIAWEPGGNRLIVHAGEELLVLDADTAATAYVPRSLGRMGLRFFTPKWIPGTGSVVYVNDDGRLLRHDLATDETVDLGEVRGTAAIAVHPSGDRAALTHLPAADTGPQAIAHQAERVQETPSVEIVDLASGARTAVVDELALWTEWSPDGSRLLVATAGEGTHAHWRIWDGDAVDTVAIWVPTQVFFSRYLLFSDQYIEQPRLWAPDSSAFVYPTVVTGPDGRRTDRIHVVGVEAGAEPTPIAAGSVAFWSPAVPNP